MVKVSKKQIKGLIEAFIYDELRDDEFEVIKINARQLLTWNRLDLAFKLYFLDSNDKNNELALLVYKQDIRAQTLDSFKEYGNNEKISFEKFLEVFDELKIDFEKRGFDHHKSYIPIAKDGSIINGSHRTALAIHQGKTVECVNTNKDALICDYQFYLNRCVPETILDIVTTKFVEYASDVYLAILWSSDKNIKKEINAKITNVVYKKEIELNTSGVNNLWFELYGHKNKLTEKENNLYKKITDNYSKSHVITIIIFQTEDINDVVNSEDIECNALLIVDKIEEINKLTRLLFNENGRHFLNCAQPRLYSSFNNKLVLFSEFLLANRIKSEDVVLDSKMTLAAYGIEDTEDIGYLTNESIDHDVNNTIKLRNDQLKYYDMYKLDMIYNPEHFFFYKNIKFLSLKQAYQMLTEINQERINDLDRIYSYIDNKDKIFKSSSMKDMLLAFKIKTKYQFMVRGMQVLEKMKMYEIVKSIYHTIKN